LIQDWEVICGNVVGVMKIVVKLAVSKYHGQKYAWQKEIRRDSSPVDGWKRVLYYLVQRTEMKYGLVQWEKISVVLKYRR